MGCPECVGNCRSQKKLHKKGVIVFVYCYYYYNGLILPLYPVCILFRAISIAYNSAEKIVDSFGKEDFRTVRLNTTAEPTPFSFLDPSVKIFMSLGYSCWHR